MSDEDDCVPALVPFALDRSASTRRENQPQKADPNAIRRLKETVPVTLITGFLGAIFAPAQVVKRHAAALTAPMR